MRNAYINNHSSDQWKNSFLSQKSAFRPRGIDYCVKSFKIIIISAIVLCMTDKEGERT